ncbi:unnamed protein product [Thlaspi arvense]|uniref:HMA domain-containing protein n=1 Tax=Thlaspi arvense TaxID=13288 RepID=A0AAU9RR82_THLAR|nr:unnamed protein product [Thlaspi arvense]
MKKMVVMMHVNDERSKEKIIRTVAKYPGITTITMDSNDGKLTVIGELDVTRILGKLERRWGTAELATFGPYDPKKEAETAAAAEKKRKEEAERQRSQAHRENQFLNPPPIQAYHGNQYLNPPLHHYSVVCDHDNNHGCVIS